MKLTMVFLLLAALGNALYHVGQKALHDVAVNPLLVLSVYYALAGLLCVVAMPMLGKVEWAAVSTLATNWRVWLVALGILLIELGFLLAYQSGGSVQWSGVAVNGLAALLLFPLALWWFHESFSWHKLLGMVLTLLGLYFLVKK